MKTIGLLVAVTVLAQAQAQPPAQTRPAQTGPAPSEIYVAPLTISGTNVTVGKPENVTNSPGYDNQPFFTPDGAGLLFTSDREPVRIRATASAPASTRPQTDIYRYDFTSRTPVRVTNTEESEYSPTVTPDGRGISVIRVEGDGSQRLWRFTSAGTGPAVVLDKVKPVGYHAWLDQTKLALFVLGEPATLQVADSVSGEAVVVTSNIGQSIARMPGGGASFVQQGANGPVISQVTIADGKPVTTELTAPVPGARQVHVAWTPDGTLLMAHSGWLHAWRAGQSSWRAVADLEALGLKGVTRLAVSPKGNRLAIVAQ